MDKQQREYIHHLMLQYSDAMIRLTYRRIFLLSLVLPLALLAQRTHRQQNVSVGIVTVGVMDGSVSAHPV